MSAPGSPISGSSGLSDQAAGILAYVTIIPALLFLILEPYNKKPYIRFHALQCLLLFVAWLIAECTVLILGFFGPFLRFIDFGLYPLISLGTLILWLMALVKAMNGEQYKLPILGDYAEKWAKV